jgi:hypothetical protein
MAILDQDALDDTPDNLIPFQEVEKSISGNIISNKNVQRRYYMILKAKEPCQATVQLKTEKWPDHIQLYSSVKEESTAIETKSKESISANPSSSSISEVSDISKYVLIGIVLICIIFIAYNTLNKSLSVKKVSAPISLLSKLKKFQT